MPLCICALTTSGVTAMPQSTAHTTRSTVILSPLTVTSATCATTEPKDSCTATPRPPLLFREWRVPSGLLGRELERTDVARMLAEQRQPERDRVLSRRV